MRVDVLARHTQTPLMGPTVAKLTFAGRAAVEELFFPYGADELDTGWWVFFNRHYKVPGTPQGTNAFSLFERGAPKFKLRTISPDDLAIMCGGRQTFYPGLFAHSYISRRIYFFTDKTVPWDSASNMKRYARVLSHFYSLVEGDSTDRNCASG